jgi:hypothetical protein
METSDVRRRIVETIDRARRSSAERRARADVAARDYARFLDRTAIPLFRQIAGSLKANNFHFTVFTPSGSVRLMSDKTAEDFIELTLDTAGDHPVVMGRTSRARGHRVIESERPVAAVAVAELSDQHLLDFMAEELVPFVERG